MRAKSVHKILQKPVLKTGVHSTREAIKAEADRLPKHAKYVIESSSVWEETYRYMAEDLDLDVILSNPYTTMLIAKSKKKTDKVDAVVLADMRRGNYIPPCYVPDRKTSDERKAVRHRDNLVRKRISYKNMVHGILLQMNFKAKGAKPFSPKWMGLIRQIDDYRIKEYLGQIEYLNDAIIRADTRIARLVKDNRNALLLRTMPGVGNFTALTVASMIGDIGRFNSPEALCAYAGLVPSVRGSADTVHHGHITKNGDKLMRWVLTECVLSHVHHVAGDSYIKTCYIRIAKKRGKQKAAVAGVSKMLRVMYWRFCCVIVTCSKSSAMSQISSVRQTPSLVQMRICRGRQPSRLDARGAGHASRAWTAAPVRRNKFHMPS